MHFPFCCWFSYDSKAVGVEVRSFVPLKDMRAGDHHVLLAPELWTLGLLLHGLVLHFQMSHLWLSQGPWIDTRLLQCLYVLPQLGWHVHGHGRRLRKVMRRPRLRARFAQSGMGRRLH